MSIKDQYKPVDSFKDLKPKPVKRKPKKEKDVQYATRDAVANRRGGYLTR